MMTNFDFDRIPDYVLHDAVRETLSDQQLSGGTGNTPYNFRCPICGDSKTNKLKKRGYVLFSEGTWTYVCHNECGKMSFISYLKQFHPYTYRSVIFHAFDRNKHERKPVDTRTKAEKTYEADNEYKFKKGELIQITDDHPTAKKALDYCITRKIPKSIYLKWYVCLKDDSFYDKDHEGNYIYNEKGYPKGNEYGNRIIIPYYRYGEKWKQFDARSLEENTMLRYKNLEGAEREMYNIDFLDVTKPFFLVEGAIDSCFIKNSVAFGGTKHLMKFLEMYPHIKQHASNGTVIWDNDEAGYDEMPKTVNLGFNWFDWTEFDSNSIKDINDLVLKTDKISTNDDGFIQYDTLKKYIRGAEGANIMLTMLYGNREKKRKQKSKENFDKILSKKNNTRIKPFF